MNNKINFPPLVADLVQQLVDLGANQNDIIYTLTYYGMNDKQIKEWYGLPYEG
jgi:hypothetical protein